MSDKPHADHVADVLSDVGVFVEDAALYKGQRAHFLVLIWTDEGVIQSITNTAQNDVILTVEDHLKKIRENGVIKGAYKPPV